MRRLLRYLGAGALLVLAACAQQPEINPVTTRPEVKGADRNLSLAPQEAPAVAYSNASLASLFVRLTHGLEWGPWRPNLVRYEAPVRVGLTGRASAQYTEFLGEFLGMLRRDAGVDIDLARTAPANMHIRFVDGRAFRKSLPAISCVLAPGKQDWRQFTRNLDQYGVAALEKARAITDMTIFIPDSAPPYLIRSCLIEEVTQALGPANDLFGLGPSIFNDDGAHVWPTSLDLLMLRVLYRPELRTGLKRRETEARARAVLDRIHPEGRSAPALPTPRDHKMARWRKAHQRVFSRATAQHKAPVNAQKALDIAAARAPGSVYHCHSLRTLGRVLVRPTPAEALGHLTRARDICSAVHGADDIRLALIALETASAHFAIGQYAATLASLAPHEQALSSQGQEERLAALYNLRAKAHRARGERADAQMAAKAAATWGAYAHGANSRWVRQVTGKDAGG